MAVSTTITKAEYEELERASKAEIEKTIARVDGSMRRATIPIGKLLAELVFRYWHPFEIAPLPARKQYGRIYIRFG